MGLSRLFASVVTPKDATIMYPDGWSIQERFDSVRGCLSGVSYAQIKYGVHEVGSCPDHKELIRQYRAYASAAGIQLPEDFIYNSSWMPEWPEFDKTSAGYVEKIETHAGENFALDNTKSQNITSIVLDGGGFASIGLVLIM